MRSGFYIPKLKMARYGKYISENHLKVWTNLGVNIFCKIQKSDNLMGMYLNFMKTGTMPWEKYETEKQIAGIYDLDQGVWSLELYHRWICNVFKDLKNNQRYQRFEG